MVSGFLFAADGDEHRFELTAQPDTESFGFSQAFDCDVPFDTEPPIEQHDVFRGVLTYRGVTDESAKVGFLWDQTEGRLYVDLNKDGDLTNDPNGILENEMNGSTDFQVFPAFPLSFSTPVGIFRYQVTADMQGYQFAQRAAFSIRSGYAGQVELYGRQWNFRVTDNFQAAIGPGCTLSVFPRGDALGNQIVSLPAMQRLFLDGRCYDTAFEFRKAEAGTPVLSCILTEKEVPLAAFSLEGKWVTQLVLGTRDMLVLPELYENAAAVFVPALPLDVISCSLKYAADKPAISPMTHTTPSIEFMDGHPIVLKIGGPLQNSVDIQRSGKILTFNYQLIGVGGEKYDPQQVTQYDNAKKPSVAIYKGDLQVGSGNFEYG
jgi:hypothetical protein